VGKRQADGILEKKRIEKKRKDYAFRRQFNEKPSIIPGCPGDGTVKDNYLLDCVTK